MLRILLKILAVIIIFCSASCISDNNIREQTYYQYDLGYKHNQPMRVKVDQMYTPYQQQLIGDAFNLWEKASGGIIKFEVDWNQPRPKPFMKNAELGFNSGIFFWFIPKDTYQLNDNQMNKFKTYLAVTIYGPTDNSINVAMFNTEDWTKHNFYACALHEIGHMIGLRHVIDQSSVMYPEISSYIHKKICLTKYDIAALCDLYGCIPQEQLCD